MLAAPPLHAGSEARRHEARHRLPAVFPVTREPQGRSFLPAAVAGVLQQLLLRLSHLHRLRLLRPSLLQLASRERDMSTESDAISISSEDSGSFSTDEHLGYAVDGRMFIRRGPRFRGTRTFDKHMVFASDMWLRSYQVEQLVELVDTAPPGPIKYYVYRMPESSVTKKSKMVFGAEFTKANLKRYLTQTLKVCVECSPSKTTFEVTMKMGLTREKPIMTTGWAEVMAEYKLKEGDIVVFIFHAVTGKNYGLYLDLTQLVY